MLSKFVADLADYEVDKAKILGRGAFGTVYEGRRIADGAPVAVKFLTIRPDETKSFVREVVLPTKMKHPAVMELYGYRPPREGSMEAVVITPLMKGSMDDYIMKMWQGQRPKFVMSKVQIAKAMYGLASALSFMHEHHLVHRDVKTGNILLDQEMRPKLADFGLSRKATSDEEEAEGLTMTNNVGSPLWMAPELFSEDGQYTDKVDVYAFAVTLLLSMTKTFPGFLVLDGNRMPITGSKERLRRAVAKGARFGRVEECSDEVWELICECWDGNPDARPTMKEVVERMHSPEFALDPAAVDEYMEYVNWVDGQEQSYTHLRPSVVSASQSLPAPSTKPKAKPFNFGV